MSRNRYWTTLRHNGVVFAPPYVPKGLRLGYEGKDYRLSPQAEEMAYAWAKKKDTNYVKDPVFVTNFMKDFRRQLPPELRDSPISKFDFSEFYAEVEREAQLKLRLTTEEKKNLVQQRKQARETLRQKYGYAEIDGQRVEIQNWVVEPPGIFMGRGAHPLRGRWKPRIEEKDITLNLDVSASVPAGSWRKIVHEPKCMWLACWEDKLSGKMKYVWPHESSFLAQKKNKIKYDKASKLGTSIVRIRKKIEQGLQAKDLQDRKIATVCYLIDKLCLRVGDEKDEDEADTVGATTLRVEHVKLARDSIKFDFLGKDSVRWLKVIEDVDRRVMRNLHEFVRGKNKDELIFDGVTSSKVNSFLGKIVPGLTAKVFRTYHATNVVRDYLWSVEEETLKGDADLNLYYAKMANLKAAILCNHKRTPPKNWDKRIQKMEEKLETLRLKQPQMEKMIEVWKRRIRKAELALEIAKLTKEYNLNTSLKNYIDPRVYVVWARRVGMDLRVLYPKAMWRKFVWANRSRLDWSAMAAAPKIQKRTGFKA